MAEKKQPNGTSKPINGNGTILTNSESGGKAFVRKTTDPPTDNPKK